MIKLINEDILNMLSRLSQAHAQANNENVMIIECIIISLLEWYLIIQMITLVL